MEKGAVNLLSEQTTIDQRPVSKLIDKNQSRLPLLPSLARNGNYFFIVLGSLRNHEGVSLPPRPRVVWVLDLPDVNRRRCAPITLDQELVLDVNENSRPEDSDKLQIPIILPAPRRSSQSVLEGCVGEHQNLVPLHGPAMMGFVNDNHLELVIEVFVLLDRFWETLYHRNRDVLDFEKTVSDLAAFDSNSLFDALCGLVEKSLAMDHIESRNAEYLNKARTDLGLAAIGSNLDDADRIEDGASNGFLLELAELLDSAHAEFFQSTQPPTNPLWTRREPVRSYKDFVRPVAFNDEVNETGGEDSRDAGEEMGLAIPSSIPNCLTPTWVETGMRDLNAEVIVKIPEDLAARNCLCAWTFYLDAYHRLQRYNAPILD